MCLCRTKVSRPPHLPPHPTTPKIITRSFVDNVVKRAKHLATCQLSCNVRTASKCAIFDQLQEKNSEHSVKTGSKSDWKKFRAEHQERVTSCMCLRVSDKSFPPPPHLPPHPKNNHTVIRRQCCETFQASCNVPSILQRANYLATSQQLLKMCDL